MALLLLCALPIIAQELSLETWTTAAGMTVRVTGAPRERIAESLSDGMRAELDLVLRVREPQEGFAGLLGDRVLVEHRIAREARFDPFSGGYRIETRGSAGPRPRGALLAEDIEDAVSALLTIEGIRLPPVPGDAAGVDSERYLTAQAVLRPLRLSRRLRLIALAIPQYSLRSAWTRLPAGEVTP